MKADSKFNRTTQKTLTYIDNMGLDKLTRIRAKNYVLMFRDSFKIPSVQYATFPLLNKNNNEPGLCDSTGFCRAANFAFLYLMGDKDWQLMYITENAWVHGPHFFLRHRKTGKVLDITADQYTDLKYEIPYDLGAPIGIDEEGERTVIRFLNSIGLDYMAVIKKQRES